MDTLREQVARYIATIRGLIAWDNLPDKRTKECGCACKESCYQYADQILALLSQPLSEQPPERIKLTLNPNAVNFEAVVETCEAEANAQLPDIVAAAVKEAKRELLEDLASWPIDKLIGYLKTYP